ncbi:MAG: hypothetical protein ACT4PE_00920 [Candidatus Eiseniibacteriota bacterium]
MRRFSEHWKFPDSVAALVPQGSPAQPDSPPPERAIFRGSTVWIHAVDPASTDYLTDDGRGIQPDDAIANVQLERYVPAAAEDLGRESRLKSIYYLLKPVMPRAWQLAAQRTNARLRLRQIDFPDWPQDDSLNSVLTGLLDRLLERAGRRQVPFLGFWPRGHEWAACLTHDVETAAGLAASDRMAGIEEEAGVRSTWFIVPERYPVTPGDFRGLQDRGHEIAVHGLNHDCREFSTRAEFVRRTPLIDAYARAWGSVGFRSPALYRNPDWIPDLAIRYDSSFMDTAVLEPQRGGVSAPFPFHLDEKVVELPITLPMDHHLINILRTDTVTGVLAKFEWVVERHGLVNALFHPDYNLQPERLRDYRAIVQAIRARPGGWIAPAAEIADWWDRRRRSSVIEEDGGARIEGPAAKDGAVWRAVRSEAGLRIEPESGSA